MPDLEERVRDLLERPGIAQVREPAPQPDERVLDEILGERAVAGQQVREPGRRERVALVQLPEPRLRDRRPLHV